MNRLDRWVLAGVLLLLAASFLVPLAIRQRHGPLLDACAHWRAGSMDAGARDAWGRPYVFAVDPDQGLGRVHSRGPDGVDDGGAGDDLVVQTAQGQDADLGAGYALMLTQLLCFAPAVFVGFPYLSLRLLRLPRAERLEVEAGRWWVASLPLLVLCLVIGQVADESGILPANLRQGNPTLRVPGAVAVGLTLYGVLYALGLAWRWRRPPPPAKSEAP